MIPLAPRHQTDPTNPSSQTMTSLSELNITPLLDLAFVLLIIFMITAPFLAESSDLIIPSSKASNQAVEPDNVYVISVDRNQKIFLAGQQLSTDALRRKLTSLQLGDEPVAVVIRADKRLEVEGLVTIMDLVKSSGITKVGVVTKQGGSL